MMSSRRESRRADEATEYSYRRTLGVRELIPAVGVGVAAGLAAFYLTKLMLERTPLDVQRDVGDVGDVAPRRSAGSR